MVCNGRAESRPTTFIILPMFFRTKYIFPEDVRLDELRVRATCLDRYTDVSHHLIPDVSSHCCFAFPSLDIQSIRSFPDGATAG